MNISPKLSEVREIAATGQYNVLPVSCELLSDFTTPIETLKILKNVSTHCYLLESAQANETWGRYSFLGFDPKLEITCIDGEMKAGNVRMHTKNPSSHLRQILADYKSPRFDYLPSFTGGLVGYFSFDYLGYSEPSVRCRVEDAEDFKDVDLMLFDKVIAFDHLRQKIILIVNMPLDDVEVGYVAPEKAAQLRQLLAPGIQAVGVFVREAPQSVAALLNSNVIDGLCQLLLLRTVDRILNLQTLDSALPPALKSQEAIDTGQHGVNGAVGVPLFQQELFVGHHHFLGHILSIRKAGKSPDIPEIFFNGCPTFFFQNQIFVKCADTVFRQPSFAHLCFLLNQMICCSQDYCTHFPG